MRSNRQINASDCNLCGVPALLIVTAAGKIGVLIRPVLRRRNPAPQITIKQQMKAGKYERNYDDGFHGHQPPLMGLLRQA
jgi:hypothetical protein